jgi:metallo-beta-lactamase class B
MTFARLILVLGCVAVPNLAAQTRDSANAHTRVPACERCAVWNAPQRPFRLYGNAYYVGTHGLSAILITSSDGHILIDGALPESAPSILASIRTLGFRAEDVKLILNSHIHYDHAGGIAEIQRRSGAAVAATASSAEVLRRGSSGPDDPQYGVLPPIAPVTSVRVISDRETLRVGPLSVTAYLTPGHTPGGTSWTWKSCEGVRCLDFVYADSQTPVSADGFLFTRSVTYPKVLRDFERGFAVLDSLPCSVLVTPHPDVSDLWSRVARRDAGDADALVDPAACRRYAAGARERLAQRVAAEKAKQ